MKSLFEQTEKVIVCTILDDDFSNSRITAQQLSKERALTRTHEDEPQNG